MRILVTGGGGFIGTNVCLEARKRGYTVVAFDNFSRPLTEENIPVLQKAGVEIVRGDVRNPEDFEKFGKIDAIIHLAGQCGIPYAQINPLYDFEVNIKGVSNLLEYSRTHGNLPMAFASSNKAYTNITNNYPVEETKTRYVWKDRDNVNEEVPLDSFGKYARTIYGTGKVASDLLCQEYYQSFGTPTVVNRMSCIYGYYQKGVEDQAWVDWLIRQIKFADGAINIFGTGKQVRDMLFGTDVARLYVDEIENIERVKGQVYNIGGGKENTMSLLEAISYIEKRTGKNSQLTFTTKRHGDQDIWISDITKIEKELGWKPTISPKEGIDRMIDAYDSSM